VGSLRRDSCSEGKKRRKRISGSARKKKKKLKNGVWGKRENNDAVGQKRGRRKKSKKGGRENKVRDVKQPRWGERAKKKGPSGGVGRRLTSPREDFQKRLERRPFCETRKEGEELTARARDDQLNTGSRGGEIVILFPRSKTAEENVRGEIKAIEPGEQNGQSVTNNLRIVRPQKDTRSGESRKGKGIRLGLSRRWHIGEQGLLALQRERRCDLDDDGRGKRKLNDEATVREGNKTWVPDKGIQKER